jgi:hypothetical protein
VFVRVSVDPIFLLGLLLCATSVDAQASARPSLTSIEHHRLDLDGDGMADDLWLRPSADTTEPGAYRQLELRLSRSGRHQVTGNWDRQRPGDRSLRGNLVQSQAVFVGHFRRAGTLILLRGEDLGCCEQALEIYQVGPRGVKSYFSRPEFVFIKTFMLSKQPSETLVGQENPSETAGTSAPDALVAGTYDPVLVYRLTDPIRLDTAASIRATRAVLGGFAGLEPRVDVMSVVRRDRTRYLWDETRKRRIP